MSIIRSKWPLFLVLFLSLGAEARVGRSQSGLFPRDGVCTANTSLWYFLYIPNSVYGGDVWEVSTRRPRQAPAILILRRGQSVDVQATAEGDGFFIQIPVRITVGDKRGQVLDLVLDPQYFDCQAR